MLFFLRDMISDRFGVSDIDEAIVSQIKADTKTILYFFLRKKERLPFLVVKVSSDKLFNDELKSEYTNLQNILDVLPVSLRNTVPAIEGSGEWKGLYYYAQHYIPGSMLNGTIDAGPGAGEAFHGIKLAFEWLLKFQEATFKGPRNIGSLGFDRLLEIYRDAYSIRNVEKDLLDGTESALEKWEGEEIDLVSCHGDFYPGNIIVDGEHIAVIDWRFFQSSYHPVFDFFSLLSSLKMPKNGITDFNHHHEHFREMFFEKHQGNSFILELYGDFIHKNRMESGLFLLLLELTLLEWSTREYVLSGKTGEMDRVWNERFLYLIKNRDRIILCD